MMRPETPQRRSHSQVPASRCRQVVSLHKCQVPSRNCTITCRTAASHTGAGEGGAPTSVRAGWSRRITGADGRAPGRPPSSVSRAATCHMIEHAAGKHKSSKRDPSVRPRGPGWASGNAPLAGRQGTVHSESVQVKGSSVHLHPHKAASRRARPDGAVSRTCQSGGCAPGLPDCPHRTRRVGPASRC
jgi:hypothetical protein